MPLPPSMIVDPSLQGWIANAILRLQVAVHTSEFWVQVFIFVTGIMGQLLVTEKNVRGFYYWMAGNVAIVASSLQVGLYGMAALYLVFIFLTGRSILKWRREQALPAAIHHGAS